MKYVMRDADFFLAYQFDLYCFVPERKCAQNFMTINYGIYKWIQIDFHAQNYL